MSFYDWLHSTDKTKLIVDIERCDEYIIKEIGMSRERLQWTLEELEKYGVIRLEYEYK